MPYLLYTSRSAKWDIHAKPTASRETAQLWVNVRYLSGVVPLAASPRLATMFLTDSLGNVLSESTAMARYVMTDIPQTPDTISASAFASLADSFSASSGKRVFVRLADADERWVSFAESDIWYQPDYGSPLPFPEAFFSEDARQRTADLQAWLGTATFRRFGIAEAIDGAIRVVTRSPNKQAKVRSMGTFYTPMGLSEHSCHEMNRVAAWRCLGEDCQ